MTQHRPPWDQTEEDEEEDRRRILLLLLLLLLIPICLCVVAQVAVWSLWQNSAGAGMLSNLAADYSRWEYSLFNPIDPELIGTIRADQLTQVAGRGTPEWTGLIPFVPLEPGFWPTEVAEVPTSTTVPTLTAVPTRTPTSTASPTFPPWPTFTWTPSPTYTPLPSPTPVTGGPPTGIPPTPVPPTSTPTPTPFTITLSGFVLNHTDYGGGAGTDVSPLAYCDGTIWNQVQVTLTDLTDSVTYPAQTVDGTCAYSFSGLTPGHDFRIVVDVTTFNSPGSAIPEQTYEFGTGGGVGALGGNDRTIPNDHSMDLLGVAATTTNVNMVFSYNAVVNQSPTGQGSLEQAIINANAIFGPNRIVFASPFGAYVINPPGGGFSTISGALVGGNGDSTTIDGSMTTSVTLICPASCPPAVDGLVIYAANVTLQGLTVQNFTGSGIIIGDGATAGLGDNARIDACMVRANREDGIGVHNADFVVIQNSTIADNNTTNSDFYGQVAIYDDSDDGQVLYNTIERTVLGRGDGVHFDQFVTSVGWQIVGNVIQNHNFNFNSEGIIIRGSDHLVSNNTITNNGVGIKVYADTSINNLIRQNDISANAPSGGCAAECLGIDLAGDGVTLNDPGDVDFGPNDYLNFPVLGPPGAACPPGTTRVTVSLPRVIVDFFLSDRDPSGYGEGATYRFSIEDGDPMYDLDGSANAIICVDMVSNGIPDGTCVTTTASLDGVGTSEFSLNVLTPNGTVPCP